MRHIAMDNVIILIPETKGERFGLRVLSWFTGEYTAAAFRPFYCCLRIDKNKCAQHLTVRDQLKVELGEEGLNPNMPSKWFPFDDYTFRELETVLGLCIRDVTFNMVSDDEETMPLFVPISGMTFYSLNTPEGRAGAIFITNHLSKALDKNFLSNNVTSVTGAINYHELTWENMTRDEMKEVVEKLKRALNDVKCFGLIYDEK